MLSVIHKQNLSPPLYVMCAWQVVVDSKSMKLENIDASDPLDSR